MNERQTIHIHNQLDIIEARMHVRTLARETGLDLFDQARISLATSTLAIILGLEKAESGLIAMDRLDDGQRRGVQVVCIKNETSLHDLASGVMDDARRMVDDLQVRERPEGGVEVTVIKWVGRTRRRSLYDDLADSVPAESGYGPGSGGPLDESHLRAGN